MAKPKSKAKRERLTIGWREWVQLEDLGVPWVKCKVDTGARSSCLHACNLKTFDVGETKWIQFVVHPIQRDSKTSVLCKAPILEYRKIRSSNGHVERRPVVVSKVRLLDQVWPIEVTLTNRDEMGFRMLLGRESIKGRFLIDTGASFYGGVPPELPSKRKSF